MPGAKKPFSQFFGESVGGVLVFLALSFVYAWIVMVSIESVNDDAPGVPALGFWACHALVLLTYFGGQIARAAALSTKKGEA